MEKLLLMADFPGLAPPAQFEVTSPKTPLYNCTAWAAGETRRRWWPDRMKVDFWPKGVERVQTLAAFIAAYETLGYEACDSGDAEVGFEKVAIFLKPGGTPAHAARQLADGRWTSKLGNNQDITHDLCGVECDCYGKVKQFMRRPLRPANAERSRPNPLMPGTTPVA
jgi:hypothetical protein